MASHFSMQIWEHILLYLDSKTAIATRNTNKTIHNTLKEIVKLRIFRSIFYTHFRNAITAIGLKWKDYPTLNNILHPYFNCIKELRANSNSFDDKICIKCCIFDIPSQILDLFNRIYIPSLQKSLTFEEFKTGKEDWKEHVKANSYLDFLYERDIMKISKALVIEQDEDDSVEKISLESFYKDDEETKSSNIDFENPEMLKKRQAKLLEKCKIAPKVWDPFLLIKNIGIWIIILCHGGKFSITVYNKGALIEHKSDTKYVTRAKAGQRQLNKDKAKKVMTSVGSQMRRDNEKLHEAHIEKIMLELKDYVSKSTAIFLHSPGMNKYFFLMESKSLFEHRDKVYSIPFKTTKAKFTEAVEVMKKLSTVKFVLAKK